MVKYSVITTPFYNVGNKYLGSIKIMFKLYEDKFTVHGGLMQNILKQPVYSNII